MEPSSSQHWRPRDTLAAALLFLGTAGFVCWQNSRVAVLWDLGYLLDTSWRIALGQMPYRDFPLSHPPLTFLIQAGLMRLGGRHYLLAVAYAAVAGGLATVVAWRIVLRMLRPATSLGSSNWLVAVLLSIPLTVLGIYSVYPHPIYDCDCMLAVLLAVFLLLRLEGQHPSGAKARTDFGAFAARLKSCPVTKPAFEADFPQSAKSCPDIARMGDTTQMGDMTSIGALAAGVAAVASLFFKQNIGLPFLAVAAAGILVLLIAQWPRTRSLRAVFRSQPALVLAGMAAALVIALALVGATAGLGNYLHWTVQFAAQRRLPGLGPMISIYNQPSLAWMLPTFAAGLLLCHTPFIPRIWARIAAFCLITTPFAGSLIFLLLDDVGDERADNLLALWPLLLIAALALALRELRRGLTLARLVPFLVLAAIHGTLLSQQLWGSTYALWPLLMLLVAGILTTLPPPARPVAIGSAAIISTTFLVCGALYAASLERLIYIQIPDSPPQRSSIPALRGMATPGPFLPYFDELVDFTAREIPPGDALLLLPGEDPFYFATGRTPQFPVTLFDPATDPYAASEVLAEARHRNVRWVIVKRVLQINENPMPESAQTMQLVALNFELYRRLQGYDVFRRR